MDGEGGGVGVPSRIMRVLCHRHEEGRTSRAGSTIRVRRVTLKMVLVGTCRSPLTTLTAKNSRTDLKNQENRSDKDLPHFIRNL